MMKKVPCGIYSDNITNIYTKEINIYYLEPPIIVNW